MVVPLMVAATLVGCGGPRPPFHPVKDDPTKNSYETYVSDQSYDEVVNRFKSLIKKQKWLSWVTRTTDCMERPPLEQGQWVFACGGRGPWCEWCTEANPYHIYNKWGIVEPNGSGSRIRMTEPIFRLFHRHHLNSEIFEKAGIRVTRMGPKPVK